MARDFRSSVLELWTYLGLDPPRFGPREDMSFYEEGARLRLVEGGDGRRMRVIGVAGTLSQDAARRARQVRAILQDNLASLYGRRGCVCLAKELGAPDLVQAEGTHPYEAPPAALSALIQDILFLQERVGAHLQNDFLLKPQRSLQPDERHDVIFQP